MSSAPRIDERNRSDPFRLFRLFRLFQIRLEPIVVGGGGGEGGRVGTSQIKLKRRSGDVCVSILKKKKTQEKSNQTKQRRHNTNR